MRGVYLLGSREDKRRRSSVVCPPDPSTTAKRAGLSRLTFGGVYL